MCIFSLAVDLTANCLCFLKCWTVPLILAHQKVLGIQVTVNFRHIGTFLVHAISQYALVTYILTGVGDKCETCVVPAALQGHDGTKAILLVCESGQLHTGQHNRGPLSEGQGGTSQGWQSRQAN